jgi:signal transduction histidine kinase/DNA-binding response OmpR family regulator
MSSPIQWKDGTVLFGNTTGLVQYADDEWFIFEQFTIEYLYQLKPSEVHSNKIWAGSRGDIGYFIQKKDGSFTYTSLFDLIPQNYSVSSYINSIEETKDWVYFFSNEHAYRYSKSDSLIYVLQEITYDINKIGKPVNLVKFQNKELFFLANGDVIELVDGEWISTNIVEFYNGNPLLIHPIASLLQQDEKNPEVSISETGLAKMSTSLERKFSENSVIDIALFKNGDLAIALEKEVYVISSDGKLLYILNEDVGFVNDFLVDLFVDKNGDLWVTGELTTSLVYTSVPVYHLPGEELDFGVALHVQLFEGKLYIASDRGVHRLDKPLASVQLAQDEYLYSYPVHNEYFFRFLEVDGELWVGSEFGLYRVKENTLEPIVEETFTRRFLRLTEDVILIVTRNGLEWLQKVEKEWIHKGAISGIGEEIYEIAIEKDGTFWAGSLKANLYRGTFLKEREQFDIEKFDDQSGLPDHGGFEPAVNGNFITITTDVGLYTFDAGTSTFEPINSINTQLGGWAEFVTLDSFGNLWTLYVEEDYVGIIKIIPDEEQEWKTFFTPFEISPDIFFDFLEIESSYLMIGGLEAIIQLDLNAPFVNTKPEIRLWKAMTIKDQQIASYRSDNPLEISFDQKNIELQFMSSSNRHSDKNEFRFKTGDNTWSTWRNDPRFSLNPILPGNHSITVQTRDFMRVESEPTVFNFMIIAPWYLSNVAYLIYAVVFLGLFIGAVRGFATFRIKQQVKDIKLREIERIIELDEMKTKLLINISHELRTPLTLVTGPVQQLLDSNKVEDDFLLHKLQVAHRNGRRLHDLVEQVLDLSRLDSHSMQLNPASIPAASFVKRVSESFESAVDHKSITIKVTVPETEFLFQADADKLEKILVNLLSNAIKFTPEKGTIQVTLVESEDAISIEIKDSGRGIKEEDLGNIFERFHSTSDQLDGGGQGIGVGLSITKEFVELHEGTITVESEEGKGAVFFVKLPKKEYEETIEYEITEEKRTENPTKEEPQKTQFFSAEKSEFTALVVEDNPDMREYISELLSGLNINVEQAENGKQGQKQVSLKKPDLIISDIMMPEMNGFEFAEWVRSVPEYNQLPIILLSARSEVEDKVHGFRLGVSDYLTKPFNAQELQARVDNLLILKKEREKLNIETEEAENLSANSELVKKLQQFVEMKLENTDLSVDELANHVAMSSRNLQRTLKTSTGFTPIEFIREVRLFAARDLLEAKKKRTISEVAYAVGFSTPTYFSKQYKKRFGISPSSYY